MRATLFDMLAAGRFVRWDEEAASCLLQDALRRLAIRFKRGWGPRFAEESPDWLPVEAAVEAADLTRDVAAFIRAVAEYEQFARFRFELWEREEMAQ